MFKGPDYNTEREKAGFNWYVGSTQGALREIAKIPIKEFNLNPSACIEAYRKGRPLIKEIFGEEVSLPVLSTPAISYGHVNCLGSKLIFPEDGEVAHTHIYTSLEEGIEALKQPVDFATSGMSKFYIDFREKMQKAFPDEYVGFSFGLEGPITTAYELRGDGFFLDIYDYPELVKEFLKLVTKSIVDFHHFRCKVENIPVINPHSGGLCDDISSMILPNMWKDFVLPYWNQYFEGITTGNRTAHVEDLRPEHLKYLEEIGLSKYDPSISPKLNPRIIYEKCRVPFGWRLGSFHYRNLNCQDIEDFVFQSATDGASSVFTYIEECMCNEETVKKVRAFIKAGKKVKSLLDSGVSRKEISKYVSASGKEKFWDNWLK
jgi:hypothetical protein